MGTRADFYIERDDKFEYLGSVQYDGYEVDNEDYPICKRLKRSKTEKSFLKNLKEYEDWRNSEPQSCNHFFKEWPWPWPNSHTTDYSYVFIKDKVHVCDYDKWEDGTCSIDDKRFPEHHAAPARIASIL